MSDGGKILFALSQGGIADHALTVHSVQTQLPGDLQPQLQGFSRSLAEGRARSRLPLHAVDGHQPGNIPENTLLVFLYKALDISTKFLVHTRSPPPAANPPRKQYIELFLLLCTISFSPFFCKQSDADDKPAVLRPPVLTLFLFICLWPP